MNAALANVIDTISRGRGLALIGTPVEVRICWLSLDPADASHPDIDNILKPFLDALNKTVIDDDRQVHRIVAEKASINRPPEMIQDVIEDIRDDERYALLREVVVVRVVTFAPEYRP